MKKRFISIISVLLIFVMFATSVNAAWLDTMVSDVSSGYKQSNSYSSEFKYYGRLKQAIKNYSTSTSKVSYMQRVYNIAKSQLNWDANKKKTKNYGYANYATNGSINHNWTGRYLKMNEYNTGNTEYTRWFFSKFRLDDGTKLPMTTDCDWCAIFVSWCMYYSNYRRDTKENMRVIYSSCADPRKDLKERLTSFNLAENKVWYTRTANYKLNEGDFKVWNRNVKNRNIDAIKIPYKKGGLIFFNWSGLGESFDHVGIVMSYDKEAKKLTYISGNDEGRVRVRTLYLHKTDSNGVLNKKKIMAYGEYA